MLQSGGQNLDTEPESGALELEAGAGELGSGRPPRQGYWRLVGRQFGKNRMSVGGLCILLFLFVVALLAPFLAHEEPIYLHMDGETYWFVNVRDIPELRRVNFGQWEPGEGEAMIQPPIPHSPLSVNLRRRLEAPSSDHWLGTDDRGRDVLSRMIWGCRISMSIGFVAVGIAASIGVVVGALAGYYGGYVDSAAQRLIEIMMCFPQLILILALLAFVPEQNIFIIMVVLGVLGWTGIARLVRGEFLKLRESDFATAARATGVSDVRLMFRHLLPNALSPVLVSATFGVAGAILMESALSFLGFGTPPPTPSWGEILSQSQTYINRPDGSWWLVTFPGVAIFVTVCSFNLVGDGLRDAMDPRLRQ